MNGTARFKRSTVIHKQNDLSLLSGKLSVMEKDIEFLPCLLTDVPHYVYLATEARIIIGRC